MGKLEGVCGQVDKHLTHGAGYDFSRFSNDPTNLNDKDQG